MLSAISGRDVKGGCVAASVVFFRADWHGCGFYRCEQPVGALVRAGVAATVAERVPTRNLGGRIDALRLAADVLVFQRPIALGLPEVIAVARREGRRVLVELDDDVWSLAPHNPAASYFTREALDRMNDCIRAAHGVIASTAALAARIASVTGQRNVVVVPNGVDPALAGPPRVPAPGRPLVVGWAGGASHRADFRVARHAILAMQRRAALRGDVAVEFHGDDPLRGPPGPRTIHGWTLAIPEHYGRIAAFDLAIAPLENSRFNRGKSSLKWMEHALHRTPMVLSDVPCYREAATEGVAALFAADATAFERQLRRLADDPALRERIGAAARAEVLARHTIAHRVPLYREVLGL